MQLNSHNLASRREQTYFTILSVLACIAWLFILVSIVGAFYAAMIALFIWFANGLAVAHLRSSSVEASSEQFPELYKVFTEVCAKLELTKLPRLYVLQSEGALNAFATRHAGRDFVVVYSSLYESLGANTDEMRFLLGHEVGHIKRKHVLKLMFLAPVNWLPLVGAGLRRSIEESCDRYGTFAAGNVTAAARAMIILAAGKEAGKVANIHGFAKQYSEERGFFISWNELISYYPTLSQRTHHILSSAERAYPIKESRNLIAYLFAFLFCQATLILIFILIYSSVIVSAMRAAGK